MIDRRRLTKDCHACMRGVASSSTHCGRTPSCQVPSWKDDEYMCSM